MTDRDFKYFGAINSSEYFKSMKEKQNLRKVAKLLYVFLTRTDEVKKHLQSNSFHNFIHHYNANILNLFDAELQLINTKPLIKKKLKELLNELKKLRQY